MLPTMYLHILGRYLNFFAVIANSGKLHSSRSIFGQKPGSWVGPGVPSMLCYNETPNSMNNTHSTVETGSCILEYVKFFYKNVIFCVKVQFILYN